MGGVRCEARAWFRVGRKNENRRGVTDGYRKNRTIKRLGMGEVCNWVTALSIRCCMEVSWVDDR